MRITFQRESDRKIAPRRSEREGAAVAEFAVIAPLLVLLTLGAIDVGQLMNVAQTVSDAAREGARLAARRQTSDVSQVVQCVTDYLAYSYPNVSSENWGSIVTVEVNNAAGATVTGTGLSDITAGDKVQVKVSLTFASVRWLKGTGFGANKVLTTTTVARRE